MSRRTYIFTGPPGTAQTVMGIIATALGGSFTGEPGSDPCLRAGPVAVYVGGHDFDDGDIDSPAGTAVPLRTAYPHLIDVRDTERDLQRQQDTAARIFTAIKEDGRITAVYVDDMQHVLGTCGPRAQAAG